jgi:ABC-2 type transport system permease protein
MVKKILWRMVNLLHPLLERQGIEADKMYCIVETKLLMDSRRVYRQRRQRPGAEPVNQLQLSLLMYGLFGLVTALMIEAVPSFLLAMIIVHTYIIFMLAMTLIIDFSAVLLDTADNQVILSKPVNSRTLYAARQVHILIYLLQFTLALAICPLVVTFIKYGFLTGLGLCLTSMLSVFVAVFLTFFLYMGILRFGSEEKLKEVITYFQIGMTIFFTLGYQLMPRLIRFSALGTGFEPHGYLYLLPPVWMAETLEALHDGRYDTLHLAMAGAAVGFPLLLLFVVNRFLAPFFAARLATMQTGGERPAAGARHAKRAWSPVWSRICCVSPAERGAFELTWKITGRDKAFRLRLYPSIGYMLVFVFIFVFRGGQHAATTWAQLKDTHQYLWMIYLPVFMLSSSQWIVSFSDNHEAAWVFAGLPVPRPGELLSGTLKALFIKYALPVFGLMYALAAWIWGWRITGDFGFGLLNVYLCFLLAAVLSPHYLPFSRKPNTQLQTGGVASAILRVVVILALVGLHYLVLGKPLVMYVLMPLLALGCRLLARNLQGLTWNKISIGHGE